ncbi:MAG: hypothetical protein SGI87_06110 [Flavobacteriales bacterium]|nr:hypothetical protein [Flavobacteriales bacterium]
MISKKRMDALIPKAIDVIREMETREKSFFIWENRGATEVRTNFISKTYHGYFSSFGADMINSTPLAAIIFFEESTGGIEKRSLIPLSILNLIRKENSVTEAPETMKKLSSYYTRDTRKMENIAAAAAALKIALRTFPQPKSNEDERE